MPHLQIDLNERRQSFEEIKKYLQSAAVDEIEYDKIWKAIFQSKVTFINSES